MTPRQLEILQHALGLDQYGQSKEIGHRNWFAAGAADEPACRELVAAGLMIEHRRTAVYPDYNCSVSETGKKAVKDHSPKPPTLTASQRRYRRFLRADSGMPFGQWLKHERGRNAEF